MVERRRLFGAGALAGLVGGLAMTTSILALRATLGITTPSEAVGDRVAEQIPALRFLDLLGRVGGYDRLKQLGVSGVILGGLFLAIVVGLVYGGLSARRNEDEHRLGRPAALIASGAIVAVAWLALVGLVWPFLDANFRGLPPVPARVASAVGLLASMALYWVVLVLSFRIVTAEGNPLQARPMTGPSGRRALVVSGVGTFFALASGGLLASLYRKATFSYDGLEYRALDVEPITPTDKFYVVTKNIVDPSVDRDWWSMTIDGLVERPRTWRLDELTALPTVTQETTLMCISNAVGSGLMSNAIWKGVPLRTLLEESAPRSGAVEVACHGADSFVDTFSFDKAMEPTTLVAYEMNGAPLEDRHGFPARIIVPGLVGEKNVKWITRIEVVDRDVKGFYENQDWGPDFSVPTRSRFSGPAFDQPLSRTAAVVLRGVAFAGDRGVSGVEVSTDDGASWQAAQIDYDSTPLAWVLWSYRWQPPGAGEFPLLVRATDGRGQLQDPGPVGPPMAARGYHRVTARVA